MNSSRRYGFQSTLPLRGATRFGELAAYAADNFNPRSPCGERPCTALLPLPDMTFQSTLPLRGATGVGGGKLLHCLFQSTLPLRGATFGHWIIKPCAAISIHAPLAGSDLLRLGEIHVPPLFQSTLPLRGATHRQSHNGWSRWYFNPRSPCGERLSCAVVRFGESDISIHAPLAGSDPMAKFLIGDGAGISIHAPLAGSD